MRDILHQHEQSGQSIIILALAMVGLIGALGLSIDGGAAMLEKRRTQNAADAGVITATEALCREHSSDEATQAAYEAVMLEGYDATTDGTTVVVNNPPTQGPAAGDEGYVEVIITQRHDPYFAQVVGFEEGFEVQSRAVGFCESGSLSNVQGDYAVVGLGTNCGYNVNYSGSRGRLIGSIHSNDDINISGSQAFIDGVVTYAGDKSTISGSSIEITGDPAGDGIKSGVLDLGLLYDTADFAPGGAKAQQAMAEGEYYVFYPGTNYVATNNPKGWMNPPTPYDGTTSSINTSGNNTYWPERGLIYVMGDTQDSFSASSSGDFNANLTVVTEHAKIQVTGPRWDLTPYMDGLLFFSMWGYDADNPLTGGDCGGKAIQTPSSQTRFEGIIYGPGGWVQFPLSRVTGINATIIGYKVSFSAAQTDITFVPVVPVAENEPPKIGIVE